MENKGKERKERRKEGQICPFGAIQCYKGKNTGHRIIIL